MNAAELDARKALARRAARAKRQAAADPASGLALVDKFPAALAGAKIVAGYWPLGSEIDPRPLMADLAAKGAALVLPRIASRAGPAAFRVWTAEQTLRPDAFGVLSPPEDAPAASPDLILVPLLAFDRAGGRLGQGGGHYDRILSSMGARRALAVGLAYAAQELVEVPAGELDQRLDWIVTDREAIRVR